MANETKYDSKGYSKTLDKLVTLAEKEYYVQMVDINRHQVVVSRAILWLLVVLIGFDFAFVEWMHSKLSTNTELFSVMVSCLVIISLAIVSGVAAFGFAILSIPAIGGYSKLYENSWAEYANNAYTRWESEDQFVYETEMNTLLGKLDSACSIGSTTNHNRGIKLRIASVLSIISAVFTCITFIVFSFNYYL
ncbi:hypothetical protein [Moritella sp. F3]|uniref:hypothetical protein n=1 Tax=Moritella sp. F3 TaxID=2718882 RepID=UPI0018E1247D|nr:hypothetical protein [Moritella sp. F3]GIC75345.1 hypothetical protein FMO001_00720 [Moritella sp. F1]GIC80490.1 hypothetical protein FMO003_07710 [Moritella sp. F3]